MVMIMSVKNKMLTEFGEMLSDNQPAIAHIRCLRHSYQGLHRLFLSLACFNKNNIYVMLLRFHRLETEVEELRVPPGNIYGVEIFLICF
jgi:hypothetical protein